MNRLLTFAVTAAMAVMAGLAPAAAQDGSPDDISQPVKDEIETNLSKHLLLPELALWKYQFTRPYPTGGLAICGQVNFAVSTREYHGWTPFYARFRDGKFVEGTIILTAGINPTRSTVDSYNVACHKP